MRKQEVDALISSTSPVGHKHLLADITDFSTSAPLPISGFMADSLSVDFIYDPVNNVISGVARLKSGGGIKVDAFGLYIDSGTFSRVGHTHVLADITNFAAQLPLKLADVLRDSNSIHWIFGDTYITGTVKRRSGGGIEEGADGLYINWSGTSLSGHTHTLSEITDFTALLPIRMEAALMDTASIYFTYDSDSNLISSTVRRRSGGGILQAADGLYVDWSGVSREGHTHALSQITDFDVEFPSRLIGVLVDTDTIDWIYSNGQWSGTVRTRSNGGILSGGDGLYIDFGSGTNQAARGNHTHSQLHNALTLGSSNSLTLVLNVQELSGEVWLMANSGLRINSGLGVDFGSGTNQVARGDHTHSLLHNPVTVLSTESVILGINSDQLLSATVRRDLNPGSGKAVIQSGSNGLYILLGTGENDCAAGVHGHLNATAERDGFMSKQDWVKLQDVYTDFLSGTRLTTVSTHSLSLVYDPATGILSGSVRRDTDPGDMRSVIREGVNGLYIQMGTGHDVPAAGDHTHTVPSGTGFRHVSGGVEDSAVKLVENVDVHPAAGIQESKLALNYPTHSNANDPTTGQKQALSGTRGTPSSTNRYVTETDPRIYQDIVRIEFENDGSVLTAGQQRFLVMPWSGTITGWDLIGDQSGSVVIDIWRDTYANFPPDVSDTIISPSGTKPTLSSQQINRDLDPVGWYRSLGKEDVLGFNIDSVATLTRATLTLRITRI